MGDCIQAIHAQTHPRIELIFIDDASSDNTYGEMSDLMSEAVGSRFENIVVERKSSSVGAHDSINRGIALAKGSHIAIVNIGDLYQPARLEKILDAMTQKGSSFGFSMVQPFVEETEGGKRFTEKRPRPDLKLLALRQQVDIAREISIGYALLRWNIAVTSGNFLFTAELARRTGPFLPLKYYHDWDFILQATTRTEPVFVAEPLYHYRLHPDNVPKSNQRFVHRGMDQEKDIVRERFLQAVTAARLDNPLCPSPRSSPGYFELFLRELGLYDTWKRVAGERITWHRTIDPDPMHSRRAAMHVLAGLLRAEPATDARQAIAEAGLGKPHPGGGTDESTPAEDPSTEPTHR